MYVYIASWSVWKPVLQILGCVFNNSFLVDYLVKKIYWIENPWILFELSWFAQTDHVMLVGQGANIFAKEMGVPEVPKTDLVTPEAVRYWEEYSKYKEAVHDLFNNKIK